MTSLTALFRRMLHGMLPAACKTCGMPLTDDPNPFFCRSCWGTITPLAGPVCPRCGRPFASATALTHSPRHLCGACRVHKPAYTLARSAYPYRPPLQDAIRLFKYQRKVTLAPALGDLLCARAHLLEFAELLIPVPLHPSRLREREFNQALLLADRLARHTGLPCDPHNLVRRRDTPSQTELSRAARRKNLRRAFVVRRPQDLAGKRLLVIDDVMTTGTTVNECAKTLRRAGAGDVFVLTLARSV